MKRRTFMKAVGASALVGTTAKADRELARGAQVVPEHDQPNILFIMPDQMRGDALSLEHHPVLLTPNIDAIGGQGAHFTRAYTTCPSCVPARRSLLTGQFPATNGMVGYRGGVPIDAPTFPQGLRDAGYATVLVGRHMHQTPYEEGYGYERQILGSTYIDDDDYAKFLDAALPHAGGVKGLGISFNGWAARPWPYDEFLHPNHWITNQSRKVIAGHDSAKPLFLTASYYAPHPPLIPPACYYDRYAGMELPRAAEGAWTPWPKPKGTPGVGVDAHWTQLDGEALRTAQAGYFGLINHIDDQLYWLVSEFKAMSRAMNRPWVIVFTSDHGEMLGDHFMFRKCEPYEGSARVPFLIQGSNELGFKPGHVIRRPVCLEDLAPTLLELAGAPVPGGMDGKSLLPLLRGDDVEHRPWLHGEHSPAYGPQQAFHMLTDGHMKYIWRPVDGTEQLFDLDHDPDEILDLTMSREREVEVTQWRNTLIAHLANRPEGFSTGAKLVAGRPYDSLVPGVLSAGTPQR